MARRTGTASTLAQAAERLDGLQLHVRGTILRFAGGGQRDQAGTGALVLAHADLVDGLGQDVGVEQFEQFEQGASRSGAAPKAIWRTMTS